MEPITLIITALTFGATEAGKAALGEAGKTVYNGLTYLLHKHFSGNDQAQRALADHVEDPQTYENPLAKAIQATKADQDAQILEQAKKLLAAADPAGSAAGKYTVTVTGGQGVLVGDGTQTNHFGPSPTKP